MQRICKQSGVEFTVRDEDLAFYERIAPTFHGQKFTLPEPELCPEVRNQRRLAFRNERQLYSRTCDATGKALISTYPVETPYTVYCYDAWWGDSWHGLDYGREYDSSRSFFEQFQELLLAVPRLSTVIGYNENCDYCNYVNYSKDSYLCFGCHRIEGCFHNWRAHWSESSADCLQLERSQLCYECIDCDNSYHLSYSQDCDNCSDSAFLFDCKGCKNCLGCTNLRSKQYCILNEQLSKEEYVRKRTEYQLHTHSGREAFAKVFAEFKLTQPHRALFTTNTENVHGDHLVNCRNVHECYHVVDAEDCAYLESCEQIKDSQDNTFSGWPAELMYQTMSGGAECYNQLFSTNSWGCRNTFYSDNCHSCNNVFGCVGVQKGEYCVLNKQYTKEGYEELCAQIASDMQQRREWGQFFPQHLSPYAYNETAAQEFYPLSKEETEGYGYQWKEVSDEPMEVAKSIPGDQLPESIADVPDDVLNWAIICPVTKRPYRIIAPELALYRQLNIPVPRLHPDERHRLRMAKRNPRQLFERTCSKTGAQILSTYAPARDEIVLSDESFAEAVY